VDDRLIKTVALKNGLSLQVLDSSRTVAGDRWQVVLTIRINIPVHFLSCYQDIQTALKSGDILSSMGESVCYEQKRVRNFVDARDKETILNNLIERFFSSSLDYVSNPDFPKRYLLMQNRMYPKRKSWYPDDQRT
jgi:hypothetical protein